MYELNLETTYDSSPVIDFEVNERIKDELERIADFEKRLIYYNKNVQSLSIYFHEVQIYFKWHYSKPAIKIYCNCKNCDKAKVFPEQEKIFLRFRAKEVKRIVKELEKASTYKDKLQFIFSVKGYHPDIIPAIYPNMAKTEPLYLAKAVIDLSPKNKAERTIYNEFVIAEFNKIAKDENGFTKQYYGFDSEKERQRLDATLRNSLDRERLLSHIKNKIEEGFNYPECLDIKEEKKNKHIIKDINKDIDSRTICTNIFAKQILGIPVDINRIVLNTQEYRNFTHYTEIFKYYRYVKDLLECKTLPHQQTETKTDKLTAELGKYGFFELSKIKLLSEPQKQSLVELICTNGLPYGIAMFDFLGFLSHLESKHFKTKYKLNKEVAKWFNSDKEGRAVKGNISSLSDYSTENKRKYTAHTHKKTVKTDYEKLK